MKTEPLYLDELTPDSKSYKVKVRVIEKGRAKTSPKKGVVYQNLLLQDEKGHKMRGALFGDQVDSYKDAFVYNGVYEIANAPIKPCSEQWKASPDELDYQMSFGRQTIIQAVDTVAGPVIPQYTCLSNIPRTSGIDEKFDILGIILYVEDKTRELISFRDYPSYVREIVVTDHSCEIPLIISAWNDLTGAECDALVPSPGQFKIVAFNALKISRHKGFSLTTTMSTTIVKKPEGVAVRALEGWAVQHLHTLKELQKRVINVRKPSADREVITIYALKLKKAANTLPDECYWLRVRVPEAELDHVYAYVGCSACNRKTDTSMGTTYDCFECNKKGCTSVPRVTFTCQLADNTGTLPVSIFTEECEKMFRMSAPEIFHMKHSENQETFSRMAQLLADTPMLVEVTPTLALARNAILKWVPKTVIIEEMQPQQDERASDSTPHTPTSKVSTEQLSVLVPTHVEGKTPLADLGLSHDDPENRARAKRLCRGFIRLADDEDDKAVGVEVGEDSGELGEDSGGLDQGFDTSNDGDEDSTDSTHISS